MTSKTFRPALKILSWNIESINNPAGSKTEDDEFLNIIKHNDIICLQETKACVELPEFRAFNSLRKTSKRPSGGVCTLVNNSLKHAIEHIKDLPQTSPDILVVKLKHSAFNTLNDIFIINTYIRPHNANLRFTKLKGAETYIKLSHIINSLKDKGDIILCGDFNARVQTTPDYLNNDNDSEYYDMPYDYRPDDQLPRNSADNGNNGFKRTFLDLILESQLKILNGRTLGDLNGNFTCIKHNGSSVVDYFAISHKLNKLIKYLQVRDFTPFSDHRPLQLQISIPHFRSLLIPIGKLFKRAPNRYKFPLTAKDQLINAQNNSNIIADSAKISEIAYPSTHKGSRDFNNELTNLLTKICDSCLSKTKPPKPSKLKFKPWFSITCRKAKRALNKAARIVSKFPNNTFLRTKYYKIKKSYKNLIKSTKYKYFRSVNSEIENGKVLNWKQFKKLKNMANKSSNEFDALDLENFESFFTNLYSNNHSTVTPEQKQELINEADKLNNRNSTPGSAMDETDVLNNPITLDELNYCINRLKNGKSCSLDLISNEIIKTLTDSNKTHILNLFNHCFNSGTYPWNTSVITPIHKKGDIRDADNYRAIAVGSCLGKLFSSILLSRFITYRQSTHPDPPNQLGFTKGAQTLDHLFTLSTIVDKYKNKKHPVYSVFVDFKKAFDSICREALFYKLAVSGISGKFYDVLRYMYTHSNAHVKLAGHLSNEFPIHKGTEQGHPLSPDLFKLFFKDLSPLLDFHNCPNLMEQKISHLLWADDLVLLALDPQTLQNQLNILANFCNKWGVDINLTKTKLLIFNGTKSATKHHQTHIDNLRLNGNELERVDSYCYLGIDIKSTGSFTLAINNLKIKSMRALMSLKRTVDRSTISFKSNCTLFDALVKPVLLYAAPLWVPSLPITKLLGKYLNESSLPLSSNIDELPKKLATESIEKVHLKFIKWAIGVHPKASNIGTWGESGRRPLIYESIKFTLNYYNRLTKLNKSLFVSLALQEQIKLKLPWYSNLTNVILHSTNTTHQPPYTAQVNTTPISFDNPHRISPKSINKTLITLHNNFDKNWHKSKASSTKLTYYHNNKEIFLTEPYLAHIRNFKHRSSVTQLRISAHTLNIETGRYKQIPAEERFCEWCNHVTNNKIIENEQHFLTTCPLYGNIRFNLYTKVTRRNNSLDINEQINPSGMNIFKMSQNNEAHNTIVGKALANMHNARKTFLDNLEKANTSAV